MLALGLLFNAAGLGVICWLIFTFAVYVLPFFVALNAGFWAYHSGAGVLGSPLVAIAAGGMTLAIAQIAFVTTQSLILRATIAALFTLPATLAGYHVALAMAQFGVPSLVWQQVFACLPMTRHVKKEPKERPVMPLEQQRHLIQIPGSNF